MYCTIDDIRKLLPATVTIGDSNIGSPQPGNVQIKRSQLTTDDAISFIRYASQEIDSRLRPFYSCPLRRTKSYETEILNDISAGTNVIVRVHDSGSFAKGDLVRIQEQFGYEKCVIKDVTDMTTIVLTSVSASYGEGTLIGALEYPDPIPLMASRLALSYGFDKLFAAEQSPDVSAYGKAQRDMASNAMDSIITGAIMLFGQEWTGKRFCRQPLYDAFKSPVEEYQFGREKSGG
jgi:hypothetical protein